MPKPMTVFSFSEAFLQKLNRRLRSSAYGDLRAIANWSTEQGNPISKSSLHRYSTKLRKVDSDMGNIAAQVALKEPTAMRKDWRKTKAGTPQLRAAFKRTELLNISEKLSHIATKCDAKTRRELHTCVTEIIELCR